MNYMFKDEPYKYIATGQLEQIPQVTAQNLYDTYKSMIHNDECAIYVVGNVNEQETRNLIQNNFEIKPFELEKGSPLTQINHIGSPKVIEEDEVDQANLILVIDSNLLW